MPVELETEPIQYEVDGHVARIWLNRPHKRNSVSQQLLQELDEARIRAENDPNVRVMVIRGREGTFCSGFDLDELQGDFVGTTGGYEIAQRSARICDAIFRSPKPSVSVHEEEEVDLGGAKKKLFRVVLKPDKVEANMVSIQLPPDPLRQPWTVLPVPVVLCSPAIPVWLELPVFPVWAELPVVPVWLDALAPV